VNSENPIEVTGVERLIHSAHWRFGASGIGSWKIIVLDITSSDIPTKKKSRQEEDKVSIDWPLSLGNF
jgi:hypothetical protein